MSAVANDLQPGFHILWYEIESVLGRGGFGITYLARDNNLGQPVAIKEYLPHDFATRGEDSTVQPASIEQEDVFSWGLERFMSEAQTLAKFKHPNVVRVLSVFKHNNTGYMVMEYEQGEDLSVVYKRKRKFSQQELEEIYYPVIDGLSSVHKEGFIHRDIKPSNIYIRTDGSPVLIDFGAARQAVGSKTKTLTSMLSIGYAPFEQYNDEPGKQGPWTDIYALGASLYQGITTEKPIESTLRGMALLHNEADPYEPLSQSGIKGYAPAFLRAIDQALMLQIHDRPQTLEDFLGMLKGEIVLPDLPEVQEEVPESTVVREKTVIRPQDPKISASTVEITEPYQPSTGEDAEAGMKLQPGTDVSEDEWEPTEKDAPVARDSRKRPKTGLAIGGLLVVVLIAAVVFLQREPTPEEVQRMQLEELLEEAQALMVENRYFDEAGTGAYSAYREVIAIDPGNTVARDGINTIARHYLLQAEQLISNRDFAGADTNLRIVNSIDPEFPGLSETLARFSENIAIEKRFKQIEVLLGQAAGAMQEGRILEPASNSALDYYRQVLELDAENVNAQTGLFRIAEHLLDQAGKAADNYNTGEAEKLLALAVDIYPDAPAIPDLRQRISSIRDIEQLLARADSAFNRQQYTTPRENNAYDLYNKVLAVTPSNRHARDQLNKIADYYANRTRTNSRSGNIATANTNLFILEKHFPEYAMLPSLRREINDKQIEMNKRAEIKRQNEIKKQAEIKRQNEIKKQAEIKRQNEIAAIKKSEKKTLALSKLLPTGVNQKQDDYQVVQDIVGMVISAFKSRNMSGLLNVAQLTSQQRELYAKIFSLYQSLNVKVAPNSFTLSKKDGIARVKFEIMDLVDTNGNQVVTSANWTKIELNITKTENNWLKAVII